VNGSIKDYMDRIKELEIKYNKAIEYGAALVVKKQRQIDLLIKCEGWPCGEMGICPRCENRKLIGEGNE